MGQNIDVTNFGLVSNKLALILFCMQNRCIKSKTFRKTNWKTLYGFIWIWYKINKKSQCQVLKGARAVSQLEE